MNDLKVIGWADYDDLGEKYKEYTSDSLKECDYVMELIAQELRKHNYHWNGEYHQNGPGGAPVLSNGTQVQCTFRTWGGIMALAYPDEIDDSDGLGYCDWAWYAPWQKNITPKEEDIL